MTENEILDEFRASDALLEGHFILSSGLHSAQYLQCARVLMDPARAARLADALVAKMPADVRDAIEIVLMMEDVVTTGLSSREAIKAIGEAGGEVIAAGALVDRSNGTANFDVPFFPLIALEVPSYADNELPAELAAIPTTKPGSRKI